MNTPADRTERIQKRLESLFQPTHLIVRDDSAAHHNHPGAKQGGGHFSVEMTASVFRDKTLPERHRLVYEALNDMMHTEIHALRIRAKTPEE